MRLVINLLATPFFVVGAATRFMLGSFMAGWEMVSAWGAAQCDCPVCRATRPRQ